MVKKAFVIGIAGAAVLILNGCMMWMHEDMSGKHAGHQTGQVTTHVKEVQQGELKMSAEIPPLWAGREAVLTVKIEELPGGRPVTGADVVVSVQRKEPGSEGVLEFAESNAREGADQGVYVLRQAFAERGWYEIVITAKNMPGTEGALLSLAIQKEVVQASDADAAGHGKNKSTTMYVIGGALMVVMMLAMML